MGEEEMAGPEMEAAAAGAAETREGSESEKNIESGGEDEFSLHPFFIDKIEIKNLRGIHRLVLHGCKRINLLFGDNGSGKTTVLEAIFLLSQGFSLAAMAKVVVGREGRYSVNDQDDSVHAFPGEFMDQLINKSAVVGNNRSDIIVTKNNARFRSSLREKKIDRENKIWIHFDQEVLDLNKNFNASLITLNSYENIPDMWDEIATLPEEEIVLEGLRVIMPSVSRVFMRKHTGKRREGRLPYIKLSELDRALPITSFGDGMSRALHVLVNLSKVQGGILLIDEVEAGLHFRRMPEFWRFLLTQAEKLNVQIFATTHSLDAIRALGEALNSLPDVDAVGFRLEPKAEHTRAVRYDRDSLVSRLEDDVEMR